MFLSILEIINSNSKFNAKRQKRFCSMRHNQTKEFDSGSGRTLAACLIHASRAGVPLRGYASGGRVSNAWITCPVLANTDEKSLLIRDTVHLPHGK